MPTRMPTDTAVALGDNAKHCNSRSLLLDRFVYAHPDINEARKLHFAQVCAGSFKTIRLTREAWQRTAHDNKNKLDDRQKAEFCLTDTAGLGSRTGVVGVAGNGKAAAYQAFVNSLTDHSLLFAQLQSRLMVNMCAGVLENAGVCLDRFGLPYIPGSAVKGCARRLALAALHEWCEDGGRSEDRPSGTDNPLANACEPFTTPAAMLSVIARVFGWCEQDWKSDSDLAWASGADNEAIWKQTAEALCPRSAGKSIKESGQTPWKAPFNSAGSVSFLSAYPVDLAKTGKVDRLSTEVPEVGTLELDVVTVHHKEYYAEPREPKDVPHSHPKWHKWKREHDEWQAKWETAPDVEPPVPNVFPAVAPGHVFAFALVPLRNCSEDDFKRARCWLGEGLRTFGVGAKTNAGYGWFECGEDLEEAVRQALADAERKQLEEDERKKDKQRREADDETRRRKAEELRAATATMTPEQKADYQLGQLTDDQFRGRLDQFLKRDKSEQEAMVRAMRLAPAQPGSRRNFWDDLKAKAKKGGKPAQNEQAIRQLSKQLFPGKESKMP